MVGNSVAIYMEGNISRYYMVGNTVEYMVGTVARYMVGNTVARNMVPGVPKKSSRVFQLFSKNAMSRNGKIGLGLNKFLNEDYICIFLNLVKCPDKVLETNR